VIIFVAGEAVRTLTGGRPRRHLVRELEHAIAVSSQDGGVG
jgi:hypothetical protein